jgi:hypothetical protein
MPKLANFQTLVLAFSVIGAIFNWVSLQVLDIAFRMINFPLGF